MILLFLIMRCTLIEATPLSLFSQLASGLSALAPAQRAGAQRLCALAQSRRAEGQPGCLLPKVMRTSPSPAHSGFTSTRPNDLDGESYIRSDITAMCG